MTSQEQAMLNDLVHKINSTNLEEKDDAAEQLLRDGLGRNQDALYMLAQTVLVQNIALEQAKQQLMQMQQAPAAPAKATSFLGSLLGHRDPQPQAPPPQQQGGYQQVQYGQPQYAQPQYAQPQGGFAPPPSGQPSFLRSAATTAAGVAAGALAFQGVESLLHGGMGGGGGFGGEGFGGGGFGGGEAPREEIINNYYDSPGGGSGGGNYNSGPDEQPQGPFDSGSNDASYGDDYTDGGGDFGGDDDTNFS
ncbi:DUF2076 family protein [Acidipila sp. EB88]|uniref:DUF2076 family protein n=1 Tax=Acidipila sp. EB88 TaxID=2305226 RepID=UPI000F5FCFF8|nr:DUF2076 family protein [Acidipila sp. EB88]RRA49409.1 DUF2076 family protein [Acidipila sp. EB88]